MAIKREFVRKQIGEFTIPVLTLELGEDIETGLLLTIDKETGKAVKATQANWNTAEKPAIGVVPYSSLEGWGEGFKFGRPEILKKGEVVDIFQYGILYSPEIHAEIQVANAPSPEVALVSEADDGKVKNEAEAIAKYINAPVYLGEDGKVTLTATTNGNKGLQKVGYLANPKTGAVRIMIEDRGVNKV